MDIFLYCVVAFIAGILAARHSEHRTLARLKGELAEKEAALRSRIKQLTVYKRCQHVFKDIWPAAAGRMGMSHSRQQLLRAVGELLVETRAPSNANVTLANRPNQSALIARHKDIDLLVKEVDDEFITEFWTTCSYLSLHQMIHALLADAPSAANSSDFRALDVAPKQERRRRRA